MTGFVIFAGLVVAGIGQWLNSKATIPTHLVKLALAVAGLLLYGFVGGFPAAWFGPPFMAWFDDAWVWTFALPGAASLIGLAPGMKTDSKT